MAGQAAVTAVRDIRPACAFVAENAEHVHIREDAIPAYTARLLARYPLTTALDGNHFASPSPEETASYILALDSLNFGSGYFRRARDAGIDFGYTVFARGLTQAFRNGELNAPEKWTDVAETDFRRIFNISAGAHPAMDALFRLFTHHLRETGRIVTEDYQGRTLNLVEAANGSAAGLADIVAQWPTFRDVADYKGRAVPLLKRAQILAADMYLSNLGNFRDMDALTIFADNRVPHVLRCDGILSYAPALAEKIDALIPLEAGGAEEVELRAVAIHAVEFMKAAAKNVTAVNLDHILWHRGSEPDIHRRPTHRTLTVFY